MSLLMLLNMVVILAGVTGLGVAYHIRHKKREARPFVCPLNFDCHTVVTSDYSKFLWIPLEIWGLLYYGLISLSYSVFLLKPELEQELYAKVIIAVSVFAFCFSVYLTGVQAFKLKQWCSYCLLSAGLSTVIAISVILMQVL